MKLPKIVLGSVLIAGAIGAMFAFKARNTDLIFVATTTAPTTLCTQPLQSYTITDEPGVLTQATTTATRPCVTTLITRGQ